MSYLEFINDFGNYEDRKVGKLHPHENKGIGVSTAYTSDEGYETAIGDKNGWHPVERYPSFESARSGHEKWVEFSKDCAGKTVNKLFWSDFDQLELDDVVLQPRDDHK